MDALLSTRALTAFYGDFQALFGIDFEVHVGEAVAIIGANGAGKSTFLKSLAGLLRAPRDMVKFQGSPVGDMPAYQMVKHGIAMVPEGRRIFPSLSVEENLRIGGYANRKGPWSLERVYDVFPMLHERRNSPGTSLSGGQQQMVAIGRALMANPKLLLCDELSLGLAPTIIKTIYEAIARILQDGMTVVIVEQDISTARRFSNRIYCFQEGRVSLAGRSDTIGDDEISKAYFGLEEAPC